MLGARLEKAKIFANRQFNIHFAWYRLEENFNEKHISRVKGIFRKCRTVCSCWMCGNPRKFFGELTLQERKDRENVASQIDEFYFSEKETSISGDTLWSDGPKELSWNDGKLLVSIRSVLKSAGERHRDAFFPKLFCDNTIHEQNH